MGLPSDLYIDLGTNNTLIYGKRQGLLLNEPSLLAFQNTNSKDKRLTTGSSAKKMLGKTPAQLKVVKPLKCGVIDDFTSTAKMLHSFLKTVKNQMIWSRSRIIISLPCLVSKHERELVKEIGYDMGASIVHLLHEPLAGAVGANLNVLGSNACTVVDIGGGTTEVVILSRGQIIAAQAVRVGSSDIDQSIIELLQSRYSFLVGEQTAEWIKQSVAVADFSSQLPQHVEVGGLNLVTGLPKKMTIDSNMIFPAVESVLQKIVKVVSRAFDDCLPEVCGDIAEEGIVLFGGGAMLGGIRGFLSENLGVPVQLAENPLMAVTIGGGKILEDSKLFDSLESPKI